MGALRIAAVLPTHRAGITVPVCTENSNPNVVMVKPPEDWV